MGMQQNAAPCNTRKRCLPWGGLGRVLASLSGGYKKRDILLFARRAGMSRMCLFPPPNSMIELSATNIANFTEGSLVRSPREMYR